MLNFKSHPFGIDAKLIFSLGVISLLKLVFNIDTNSLNQLSMWRIKS